MAQVLKPELRASILASGEALFAEAGYQGATMARIAERAGMATGNLYRYFPNKDALFDSVITDEFATRFMRLLNARMKSLVRAEQLTELDAKAQRDAEELLRFWIDERLKVVIILDRAHGSRREAFGERFIDALMKPSLLKLSQDSGGARVSPLARFLLTQLFRNTLSAIVAILETYQDEAQIRAAIAGFWSYQLAGLAGFTKWVTHA